MQFIIMRSLKDRPLSIIYLTIKSGPNIIRIALSDLPTNLM